MRLINTEEPTAGNFRIQEFKEEELPKYAILSHTWESEEITLKDMEGPNIPNKHGYEKIRNCCSIARNAGFEYAWVDTCCIDKTSSSELSEAINSMYRWYQQADICYAYLADVPAGQTNPRLPPDCKWFTRGWTLQELIAPADLIFLDKEWGQIGSKSEPSIQEEIYKITNIPVGILSGDDIETASIAQRMSWAANRRTTRLEDRAYCLMGIFDINMPLLYGEGAKAFIRLQEEIIKISDDHSIFAWRLKNQGPSGLLATSPDAFRESANIVVVQDHSATNSSWTINNKGIQLTLPFIGIGQQGLGLAVLQCAERGSSGLLTAIYLRDVSLTMERFERVYCGEFKMVNLSLYRLAQYPPRQICVRQRRLVKQKQPSSTMKAEHGELAPTFQAQLGFGPEEKDQYGRTHLSNAAEKGDLSLAWLLLTRTDVDVHSRDSRGLTPLMYAARQGHEVIVTMILARDSQGHWTDKKLRTPLSHAAECGHAALVRLFLSRSDLDYDTEDIGGRSPLSYAAENGHAEIAELLLNQGADLNKAHGQSSSPFHFAVSERRQAIVAMFLNRGVDVKQNLQASHAALHWAVDDGHKDMLAQLLDQGAQINGRDHRGWTPIMVAADKGHAAIVEFLLSKGADTSARDQSQSPPMLAAKRGHKAIVSMFHNRGIDFESRHGLGHNLLYEAAEHGQRDMVALLLGLGANVNARDPAGWTSLIIAAKGGHVDVVEYLLRNGAKAEARSSSGWTALMWAAENGHQHIVTRLLGVTASTEAKVGTSGQTLLSWAAKKGINPLVEQLCQMGADVEARDDSDLTPLLWASKEGRSSVVQLLLDSGADSEAKSNGLTALGLAKKHGHTETANILVQNCDGLKPKAKFGHALSSYIKGQGRFRSS